jgi:ribonuclease Z
MVKMIFLGTAYSIPDLRHGNTQLAIQAGERTVLIDSSGDPIVRLEKAGIDPHAVTDLVLTHFHPDHVSGVPLLLMDMWLMNRTRPLHVYGLAYTIDRVETMMQLYDWRTWDQFYPVTFHRIPDLEWTAVIQTESMQITSSPMKHFIPSIGLRIEFPELHTTVTYSADTAPCPQMVSLAKGADILIHEATGASAGHSSARQAGEVAQAAGVKCLYLIHYPARETNPDTLIAEARSAFSGPILLAEDFETLDLGPASD